jgi:hypothetical protein
VDVMSNTKFRLTFPNGKANEVELEAGQVLWMEAGSHHTENTGTEFRT